jgi:hypothetical protein
MSSSTAAGREPVLYAEVGDRLVIRDAHGGATERSAEILLVRRADGGPPYLVRWSDTGNRSLVYPGVDARVVPRRQSRMRRRR